MITPPIDSTVDRLGKTGNGDEAVGIWRKSQDEAYSRIVLFYCKENCPCSRLVVELLF
jgi:uncharacterized protein YhfF